MSERERPEKFGVLRLPGGIGRPEETREVITSTQTSGGLGGGDPQGGPKRTPEREAFDRARHASRSEDPEAGETAGYHSGDPLRAEDAVSSTPPHGDKLRETDDE